MAPDWLGFQSVFGSSLIFRVFHQFDLCGDENSVINMSSIDCQLGEHEFDESINLLEQCPKMIISTRRCSLGGTQFKFTPQNSPFPGETHPRYASLNDFHPAESEPSEKSKVRGQTVRIEFSECFWHFPMSPIFLHAFSIISLCVRFCFSIFQVLFPVSFFFSVPLQSFQYVSGMGVVR